jgi:hypothetical protein
VSDSIAGLPRRISLDTTHVTATAVDQRKLVAADAIAVESYVVSDGARHPIASASWTPLPNGELRLSIAAAARTLDLQRTSATTFTGLQSDATVTLRRIDCTR